MYEGHVIYGVIIPEDFWQKVHEMDLATVPKEWIDEHMELEEDEELCADTLVDALADKVFDEIDVSLGEDPVYFGIELFTLESPFKVSEIPQVTEDQISKVMRKWDALPTFIQTLMGDIEFDTHIIVG